MRFVIVLFLSFSAFSQDEGLSLRDCINQALKNDPGVLASAANVEKARAVVKQARSAYFPSLDAHADFTRLNEPIAFKNLTLSSGGQSIPVDLFEMSDDQTLNANIQLRVPLYTWGRISNNKKRALLGVDMASSRQQNSRITAINQVVIAHSQVMLAREARKYLKDTISEMDLFSRTAKADFEAGARNAPEKDVLQIQYDLYDMKTWLQELDKWEALGLEALKISMGVPPETELTLTGESLPILPFKPEAAKTIQLALNTNPQIKELEKAIEATRLARKIAKVGNLPMIGAFGSQSWIEDDYDANPDSITAYGIGMEMKVFDGGLARNKAVEAELQVKEMTEQLKGLKRAIQLQITQEIIEIRQYYNQLEIRANAREIAKKQVEVVQQGYQYGISTVKDVNDSQVQKRWSDANWLFKKLDYIKAVSHLNQSIGQEL